MKVIYSGIRAESYDARRAPSFEYSNFYLTLTHMPGVRVIEYPYDPILAMGKEQWNEELLALVRREKPDLFFAFMYTDEFEEETLDMIRATTKSVAWFADDYWRFWNYSKRWAPHFTLAVTTYEKAREWYRAAGINNVAHLQWACNTYEYKQVTVPAQDIEVSFIGQRKPSRAKLLQMLQRAGIHVEAFGFSWGNGRVSHEEALRIVARSKISLNINVRVNVRGGMLAPRVLGRIVMRRSLNRFVPDLHFIENLQAYWHFPTPHTHARPFELAGCGGFVISGWSEDIGKCYKENKEMVFYRNTDELIQKIKYFSAHGEERERIARAGYERTLRDHTYKQRFKELFKRIGLSYRTEQ